MFKYENVGTSVFHILVPKLSRHKEEFRDPSVDKSRESWLSQIGVKNRVLTKKRKKVGQRKEDISLEGDGWA